MQSYTLTNLLVTIRNDQAKGGQESTFYVTTPPLISIRLLSLFLASEKVKVLNHPPYSPDLSPCNFFLFPRLQKMLSGNLFVCVEVLRPSQPNGVMSSAVSLPNHTFTGQA